MLELFDFANVHVRVQDALHPARPDGRGRTEGRPVDAPVAVQHA